MNGYPSPLGFLMPKVMGSRGMQPRFAEGMGRGIQWRRILRLQVEGAAGEE